MAGIAATFEEFAMHMEDTLGAGKLVKIVDILGTQEEAVVKGPFKGGDGEVSGIGLGLGGHAAAHGIEIPNQARIAAPGMRRGNFLDTVFPPEAASIAKRGNAALRADAGTGENEKPVGGRDRNCCHEISAS
jgi:hypothetical protein